MSYSLLFTKQKHCLGLAAYCCEFRNEDPLGLTLNNCLATTTTQYPSYHYLSSNIFIYYYNPFPYGKYFLLVKKKYFIVNFSFLFFFRRISSVTPSPILLWMHMLLAVCFISARLFMLPFPSTKKVTLSLSQ